MNRHPGRFSAIPERSRHFLRKVPGPADQLLRHVKTALETRGCHLVCLILAAPLRARREGGSAAPDEPERASLELRDIQAQCLAPILERRDRYRTFSTDVQRDDGRFRTA